MNIMTSVKYQAKNISIMLLWYYLVMLGFSIITKDLFSTGTVSVDVALLLFLIEVTTFKTNFLMSQQNGVSRKNQFISHGVFSLILVSILLIMDLVFLPIILHLVNPIITGYGISLTSVFAYFRPLSIRKFITTFMYYSLVMSLGHFIGILFYRSKTVGKVILAAFLPISAAIIDLLIFDLKIIPDLIIIVDKFAAFISSINLFVYTLLYILIIAIVRALSWLIMRKTVVK